MDANKGWLLKILTGPHVGSEAVLSPGVYLLGSGENCDIILHDTSLAEQHFQLTLEAHKISLSILAEDHPCYIDGAEIDADSIEINSYQVVSTGTFFFTFGSVQEAWPPIELLGAGRNFKQAEDKTTKEALKDGNRQPSSSSSPLLIPAAWRRLWRNNEPAYRIYLSVGIALIGIGISLLLVVFTAGDVPRENLETRSVEINELIEEYVVDATVRTMSLDGEKMLHIHGYTKTDEQREAFMEALGKAKITAQTQLYSSERLQLAVSVILGQFLNPETDDVEVSSVSGFPGKVMLSGYVEKSDVWKRVLDILKNDIPGLQDYDSQVRTMDDAVNALKQMLENQGFSDKVDINVDEHTIYLTSQTLSDSEQLQLAALSKNFREHFGNHPSLADTKQVKSKINKFSLDIELQSISFGQSPYLETQDGKRYTIGATLNESYTIKEINREFILLSKDGELGRYYFNEQSSLSLP